MPPDPDTTLVQWLDVAGTFAFGLSGGLAAVRARLDLLGALVLAAVVAMAAASCVTCSSAPRPGASATDGC